MKAFVINGSPHADAGNTALILKPCIEGMMDAGATVSVYYTKNLRINPCQGEYACWFKTPGRCFQNDDMQPLLDEISGADILVFATPVYVDGATGPLKNLMDRLIPIGRPEITMRDGHCRHPQRRTLEAGTLALVSNCGFWELDNFDPLLVHMKAVARNLNREFAGAILRPHGGFLKPMLEAGMPVHDILDGARSAGVELVRDRRISEESERRVSRELLPRERYIHIANERTQRALEKIGRR